MADKTEAKADVTNLGTVLHGVVYNKAMSIRPFKGATEKKTFNVAIDFDGVTLSEVIAGAVASDIIKLQNPLRDKYDALEDGTTIKRKYSAPVRSGVTQEEAEKAVVMNLANKSPEEKLAYINELETKYNK